jgi:hypothetical protein
VQGTKQDVAIYTSPSGASASFAGTEVTTPANMTIDRKTDWRVVRASKPGYHDACDIVGCPIPGLLAFLDFFPGLGISFVIDRLAGGLRQCPDAVRLGLQPVQKGTEPIVLPSDSQVLSEWTLARRNRCQIPLPVAEAVWAVDYDVTLMAVDRPGQPRIRYGPVERVGLLQAGAESPASPVFRYRDPNIEVKVAPVWDGIQIHLQNRTSHAAKIVWDEVVFVDFDQTSHRVIHGGVRYVDRHQSQPPSVVAPHKLLIDKIVPVNRIDAIEHKFYHRELVHDPLRGCNESEDSFMARANAADGEEFSIFLPIEIGGTVNEYTFHFRIENPQFGKGTRCLSPEMVPADATVDQGTW